MKKKNIKKTIFFYKDIIIFLFFINIETHIKNFS